MTESANSAEVENEAKQLKRNLEGWREVLLPASSLLKWERPVDPGIIFGATSFLFLLFWYLDPSVLTTVAFLTMIVIILDYLVPIISAQFIRQEYWTAKKERKLEQICKELAVKKLSLTKHVQCYVNMRNDHPKKFYAFTVAGLAFLTWIGNAVSNILLTYVTVTAILMAPGLNQRGWLEQVQKIFKMLCCGGKESTKKLD